MLTYNYKIKMSVDLKESGLAEIIIASYLNAAQTEAN